MQRGAFLKSIAQLATLGCLGCAACTYRKGEPLLTAPLFQPFTVDLRTDLLQKDAWLVRNQVLVLRISNAYAADAFTAVQATCTHAGGDLWWNAANAALTCAVHGSLFTAEGLVLQGPAFNPLTKYNVRLQDHLLIVSL